MSAQEAHNEQTDAMTLWVAERTLRQYGQERMANDVVTVADAIATGQITRQNSWPLPPVVPYQQYERQKEAEAGDATNR